MAAVRQSNMTALMLREAGLLIPAAVLWSLQAALTGVCRDAALLRPICGCG